MKKKIIILMVIILIILIFIILKSSSNKNKIINNNVEKNTIEERASYTGDNNATKEFYEKHPDFSPLEEMFDENTIIK